MEGSDATRAAPLVGIRASAISESTSQLPAFQDRATRTVGRSTALAPRPPVAIRLDFHLRTLIHTTGRGLDHALKASSLRYRVRLRGGLSFSLSLLRCFQAVETSSVFLSSRSGQPSSAVLPSTRRPSRGALLNDGDSRSTAPVGSVTETGPSRLVQIQLKLDL